MQRSIFDLSAILVHVADDAPVASELAAFLHNGLRIDLDEAEGLVSSTLVAAFQDALSAGSVIVLLSPKAVASRGSGPEWERAASEAAESGVRTASLVLETCVPPGVLRRGRWFDGSQDRLAAFRAVKRWLLEPVRLSPQESPDASEPAVPAELEALRTRVADVPGSVALPAGSPLLRHLLRSCYGEFEATVWMDCALRTCENFLGELGARLGLALHGPVEANLEAMSRHLEQSRTLLALENVERHHLDAMAEIPPGRYSLVTTAAGAVQNPDPQAVFEGLRGWHADPAGAFLALAHADAAYEQVLASNWKLAREIGQLAALLTRRHRRNAEADVWLERLENDALNHYDRVLAFDCARERAWIAEEWGQGGRNPLPPWPQPEQLSLFA